MQDADWMVAAMRDGRVDQDVIAEVAGYLGMGGIQRSLPGD